MTCPVAIIGLACRYADSRSPQELWENVLAQRRAFRRIPPQRLRLEDYFLGDRTSSDSIYITEAALIEDYEFDRLKYRVAGSTFRAVDLTHWLALDVAAQALADAGFPDAKGLARERCGVLVGNTLTGEFSRAAVMRLRWPYVRRVTDAALGAQGWPASWRAAFLADLEMRYKAPFPPPGEETLAGGLANVIAGRICNYFDLKGGGYTLDGACSSSLLAVANACSALAGGDLDVVLAGGVDLSIDPFELVGFARIGALAPVEMRVFDARSAGFWPGEGCGFAVLMRYEDAVAQGLPVHAVIHGWGLSSDGSGGLTRPEVAGQLLAIQRAYSRAGFGIETVPLFEGHGTGTAVGDSAELRALSAARRERAPDAPPAAIGSVKSLIGHTKAAAGMAGLIKAAMALSHQVLPPSAGFDIPHPELTGEKPALRLLIAGEPWPVDQPLRAGVSAMGFGGINAHVVLCGAATVRRPEPSVRERVLIASPQDSELILIGAGNGPGLLRQVDRLWELAPRLSRAEIADLSAEMAARLGDRQMRAAVVAATPTELANRLGTLRSWLEDGETARLDTRAGVFLGSGDGGPRVAFLFPGQGSPAHVGGGVMRRRFDFVQELYDRADLPEDADGSSTAVAQPAIVTASLAGLRALHRLGVHANLAVGHSLGELTALHWAGALPEAALLALAAARGRFMAGGTTGAMASVGAGPEEVGELLANSGAVIACYNSPRQTVIAGERSAVAAAVAHCRTHGLAAVSLPVTQAFHSPLVAGAAALLAPELAQMQFLPLGRTVVSTVTGTPLAADTDLRQLICRQLTAPVQFAAAIGRAAPGVDLFIEVGPGHVLSGLVSDAAGAEAVPIDAGGPTLSGLWRAVGAAFALGAPVQADALHAGRFNRPFHPDKPPHFFMNPCELAPLPDPPVAEGWTAALAAQSTPAVAAFAQALSAVAAAAEEISAVTAAAQDMVPMLAAMEPLPAVAAAAPPLPAGDAGAGAPGSQFDHPLSLVRELVAQRTELPLDAIADDAQLLADLHLNSINVAQLVAEAARRLGMPVPTAPQDYARATVAEVARTLYELMQTGGTGTSSAVRAGVTGVDAWVRPFAVELIERPRPRPGRLAGDSNWQVLASPDHPLASQLATAFAGLGGSGTVVCLPPEPDERQVPLLLQGARAVLQHAPSRFVLVQHGGGAAGLARTLHLEKPEVAVCVVDVPADHPQAAGWVAAEAAAAEGYTEAHYDRAGVRREPLLRLLPTPLDKPGHWPLGPDDVLLVTGGGKGIGAECALAVARSTGARLVLLGRSAPQQDLELAANLTRMAAAGIRPRYIPADVTEGEAVTRAIREAEQAVGPITAVLHAAGTNSPKLLHDLDEDAFGNTIRTKVGGLRNVLAALDPERIRLLVTFGSVIARTGLRGEGDYAVANEWQSRMTEQWQVGHPRCRCLALEWSVWSGVGMGERLGRVEALVRDGISPISPDAGVAAFCSLVTQPLPSVAVVVTGRLGDVPTLRREAGELPLLRFLEQPLLHYPGLELVADVGLSADTDPYLDDHVLQGERLLPGVVGLEAMAQAAMAVVGASAPPVLRDVRFSRPVVIPERGALTIRLAALVREPGRVDVVLRSAETEFQAVHFSATCLFSPAEQPDSPPATEAPAGRCLAIDCRDLYGDLLFQRGRLQRLLGVRKLSATEVVAEIAGGDLLNWFSQYLPPALVLGDPGARDACLQAIQVCIPEATVLPVGVDRLVVNAAEAARGPWLVHARERAHDGDTFVYDLECRDASGRLLERWEGLILRTVQGQPQRTVWLEPLLAAYLERTVRELIAGPRLTVAVETDPGAERRARSDEAMQRALGERTQIRRRPDGKPEVAGERQVTAAHTGDLTLAMAGTGPIGCDAEAVVPRSASVWQDLLGEDGFRLAGVVARAAGEDGDTAATRVWTAQECLRKAGAAPAALVLQAVAPHGWLLLAAGALVTATFVAQVRGERRLVLALLGRNQHASL